MTLWAHDHGLTTVAVAPVSASVCTQVPEGADVLVRRYDSRGRIVGNDAKLVTEDQM